MMILPSEAAMIKVNTRKNFILKSISKSYVLKKADKRDMKKNNVIA